ncbi:MarR family winged helix-turn-helix transcriptional regulator [Actinoallomurus sp. CA-150999]|uniref:MarR family winged helix-turn-helix transcriptional regulator n=1 Tax=Actinoallomurus sp. CA-150999 TaxID=3239887 RepID=UPI003D93ED6E
MTEPDRRRDSADDLRWAELADLVLIIAREIQFRGYADERAVPLSQSEGMVMRYLLGVPAAPPSRIAAATGLQRTNLSAVLRTLEGKGLIERQADPDDGRGVTVRATQHGKTNYALVRHEWATILSAAAGGDSADLDAALGFLRAVEAALVSARPQSSGP